MPEYISQLRVSLNRDEEKQLKQQGFSKINVDLNEGAQGNRIYLWFQTGSSPAISRIQFSFSDEMSQNLISAGFSKIDKNLNAGAGGDDIYLWYYNYYYYADYYIPIVDLQVTTKPEEEAEVFKDGWERLACDLNRRAKGNSIYLWVKREKKTYICDVTATDSFTSDVGNFQNGFIRVDEDTNRGVEGNSVFIWYRHTTDAKRGLTDLQISTNDKEYKSFQNQHYKLVDVTLNKKSGGNPVHLWYKKDDSSAPIRAVSVVTSQRTVELYEKAEINVVKENLNSGNSGPALYLCFYP